MPTGRTRAGRRAEGALVIVYHMDGAVPEMLMGEETKYVTDYPEHVAKYASDFGRDLREAFMFRGDIADPADVAAAHAYFSESTASMEATAGLDRITYADFRRSSKAGFISAKPRFVPPALKGRLGFTKGGYNAADPTLEHTAVREVREETGVDIDIRQLVDTGREVQNYAIFLYKLTPVEYRAITAGHVLDLQNAERFNELQNIRFAREPARFANTLSETAYNAFSRRLVGGSPRGVTRRSPAKAKGRAKVQRRVSIKVTRVSADSVYTEKQQSHFCGQHALNHILQEQKFVSSSTSGLKYKRLDGKIDLKAFCKHVRTTSRKELGPAANETIDCPADGDYQADILVRVIKDELKYTVIELPFHEEGIEALKKQLPAVRPRLLGLLVNIGGYHWTAVVSRLRQPHNLYVDSLDIPKAFDLMTDANVIDHLAKLNPYRIYIISIPESGPYYRCRQC